MMPGTSSPISIHPFHADPVLGLDPDPIVGGQYEQLDFIRNLT